MDEALRVGHANEATLKGLAEMIVRHDTDARLSDQHHRNLATRQQETMERLTEAIEARKESDAAAQRQMILWLVVAVIGSALGQEGLKIVASFITSGKASP